MATAAGSPSAQVTEFKFGPWTIYCVKGTILKSNAAEELCKTLDLPQVPEMTFGENTIRISHSSGFSIGFNAIDALKLVDNKNDLMKVAVAKEWVENRKNCEFISQTVEPFDWTFSTPYKGTLHEMDKVKVEETQERINIDLLKARERIAFFSQVVLFEDELADHGCAELTVKIRVMPSCFFLLMRYFLRVDGLVARIHDTRLFHECGKDYLIREYTEKESTLHGHPEIPPSSLTDSNNIDAYLKKKYEILHKLRMHPQNVGLVRSEASSPVLRSSSSVFN